jgi:nitrite reductase/ring-hydroxylating ferredoxin subunit
MAKPRKVVKHVSTTAMYGALIAGYGAFAAVLARFLFPPKPADRDWQYLAKVREFPVGKTLVYKTPAGETVNVTHRERRDGAEGFVALSSTCPHLGCQVHWESKNQTYFCPCHNGVFAPDGTAVKGPPAQAKQSLPVYPLKVEDGLLYIEVPLDALHTGQAAAEPAGARGTVLAMRDDPAGPGHDPCLASEFRPRGERA